MEHVNWFLAFAQDIFDAKTAVDHLSGFNVQVGANNQYKASRAAQLLPLGMIVVRGGEWRC